MCGDEKDSLKRDYKRELPRVAATEPVDALDTFKVVPGFRLELVAHEPLIVDPIAMSFDEDGRLFVIEMRGYSEQADENLGRVRRLTDSDGDGKYDQAHVYADGLSWPTAVCCYGGGVFVAAAPDIWFFKDDNCDGRADTKQKVFTGFGRGNVQGLVNTLLWGPDNRIHGATSSSGATLKRVGIKDTTGLSLRGRDFSFDPRTFDLRAESGGGQHGMSFNDAGEKFVCSNSDHLQMVMFEDRYVARNPYWKAASPRVSIAADGPQADVFRASPVEPWRIVRTRLRKQGIVPGPVERGGKAAGYFTGATGVTICRGSAFMHRRRQESSPLLYGCAIVGDVGSNLVHRKRLERDGVKYVGRRIDEKSELVASTDIWFRPAQFANGPAGALYIADMYREVIEHPKSLHPVIKQHLDLTAGRDRGRIYRLTPDDFKQPRVLKMSQFSLAQFVAALDHANAWRRETALRLLYQKQDRAAVQPLNEMARHAKLPQGRIAALIALDGLDSLSPDALWPALEDDDPIVRRIAVRLSERLAGTSPALRDKLCGMVDDEDIGVQYQLAFTLGEFGGPQRNSALAKLLLAHPQNASIRLAVGSSLHQGSGAVLAHLIGPDAFVGSRAGLETIRQIAAQIGRQQRPADVAAVVKSLLLLASARDESAAAVILTGLNAAEGSALRKQIDAASGGRASERIRQLVAGAARTALNGEAANRQRVAAVAQLQLGDVKQLEKTFDALLSPEQPADVQTAAVEALAAFDHPQAASLLIARWPSFTPATRRRAGDALFSRDAWVALLLDAVEAERIPLSDIQAEHLHRFADEDSPLALRVRRLLGESAQASPRDEVVAAYQPALEMHGDIERGRAAFKKHCAACHKLGDVGHAVGPNLAALQNRGAPAILVNVLDPNREVNPQYLNYIAVTKKGRKFSGLIAAETAGGITLARGEGASDTLLRIDIDELTSTGKSLMPEGLEKEIDQQMMADLLAFLEGDAANGRE